MSTSDNGAYPVVLVIPITTRYRGVPSNIPVFPPEGGLRSPSLLLCEQMRSLSLERFGRRIGRVQYSTMDRVFETLHTLMEMRCPPPETAPESRWIRS
jgi:mRNA interferase MazF